MPRPPCIWSGTGTTVVEEGVAASPARVPCMLQLQPTLDGGCVANVRNIGVVTNTPHRWASFRAAVRGLVDAGFVPVRPRGVRLVAWSDACHEMRAALAG
jgi:hypothetical protein